MSPVRIRSGPLYFTGDKMKQVRIVYCKPCGYLPTAAEMKNRLEKKFGSKVSVQLEAGDKGIYDVFVDNKLVFSKHKEFRFPTSDEIAEAIK